LRLGIQVETPYKFHC